MNPERSAVVLLSGGLLSALALETAVRQVTPRVALHFPNGRRTGEDYRAAMRLAQFHGIPLEIATLPTAIAGDIADRGPGLYALMATLALAYAARIGVGEVWSGMSPAGRPDRADMSMNTIRAVAGLGEVAFGRHVAMVVAPAIDQVAAFEAAAAFGILERMITDTHDCEGPARGQRFVWGFGCGSCSGCQARATAWGAFERSRGVAE